MNLLLAFKIKNLLTPGTPNWKISFVSTKDIVTFLGKAIGKKAKTINEIQIKLKQNLDKEEHDMIQNNMRKQPKKFHNSTNLKNKTC